MHELVQMRIPMESDGLDPKGFRCSNCVRGARRGKNLHWGMDCSNVSGQPHLVRGAGTELITCKHATWFLNHVNADGGSIVQREGNCGKTVLHPSILHWDCRAWCRWKGRNEWMTGKRQKSIQQDQELLHSSIAGRSYHLRYHPPSLSSL